MVMGYDGTPMSELTIPGTLGGLPVAAIWQAAFANNQLTSVTIPSGVTAIGAIAFENNELTSIAIPSSVTSIGFNPFRNNPSLGSITVSQGNQHFRSIDGVLYNRAGTALLAWPGGKSPVNIPNTVTSIGHSAFWGNQLTSVIIPSNVTSIGAGAFSNNQLTNVIIPPSVTSIETNAFQNNNPFLTSVTIPFASVADADAAWGTAWRNQMPAAFNNVDYEGWVFEPPSP